MVFISKSSPNRTSTSEATFLVGSQERKDYFLETLASKFVQWDLYGKYMNFGR